ncbi:MAG: hypothetical protein RLZZ70_381, partial [Candidatus Parcubacteria bacterium]
DPYSNDYFLPFPVKSKYVSPSNEDTHEAFFTLADYLIKNT